MECKVYCVDNLKFLEKLRLGIVDFIYIDPPFFTQKDWVEYNDKWESVKTYLNFLEERLFLARRVLKETGVIAVHCDSKANYKIRALLDDLFGEKNFINEIVWDYKLYQDRRAKKFNRSHDTIFIYSKSKEYTFNAQHEELSERKKQRIRQGYDTKTGEGKKHLYIYDQEKTNEKFKAGLLKKEDFCKISKVNTTRGRLMGDIFRISSLNPVATENTKYPTQKPLELLDRLIKAFTNEGDLVCDFFCGSGTTLVSAKRLGRDFIGCDINKKAVTITEKRLSETECQRGLFGV